MAMVGQMDDALTSVCQDLSAWQEMLRGWSDRHQTDEKLASSHQTGISMISVISMRNTDQDLVTLSQA